MIWSAPSRLKPLPSGAVQAPRLRRAPRVAPARWAVARATALSGVTAAWLATRILRLVAGEWAGAAHLPYSGWVMGLPAVFALAIFTPLAAWFHLWFFARARVRPATGPWLALAGSALGLFGAGLALLFCLLPPWPQLALANRASHYCVNQIRLDWCEHLARRYPAALARLPGGIREAFRVSGDTEALRAKLEFERLPEGERREIVRAYERAYQAYHDGQPRQALLELKEVLRRAPELGDARDLQRRALADYRRALARQAGERAIASEGKPAQRGGLDHLGDTQSPSP